MGAMHPRDGQRPAFLKGHVMSRRNRPSCAPRRFHRPEPPQQFLLPAPLLVAYQGGVGVVILSGEFVGPGCPYLYGLAAISPAVTVDALRLDLMSPFAADTLAVLSDCYSDDPAGAALSEVVQMLPADLNDAGEFDVLAFDLRMPIDGAVTAEQRARLRGAVRMFHADEYASGSAVI